MIKQSLKLVLFLVAALVAGIIATLLLDQFKNVAVEKNLRKALEMEIRDAAASFKATAKSANPEEVISFMKQYSSTAMKDKVVAVNQTPGDRPNKDEFKFLFTFTEGGHPIDFYISTAFLENELAILDTSELIFGVFVTVMVFAFIVIYAEKRKQGIL
jgi:hypothetical protein